MKEYAVAEKFVESHSAPEENLEQYYSVEIPIIELGVIYQFKIWQIQLTSMSILVKENSALLSRIRVGDILNMKYYSTDLIYPYQNLDTEIQSIDSQEHGRLKGHYLVSLGILKDKFREKIHWPYRSDEAQIFSFNSLLRNI